ncbi:MAG: OmpA family protein, partial [Bdellovibrionales bacterium]|nr:OmpA family protein [Bdellovibrionales bacterium]
ESKTKDTLEQKEIYLEENLLKGEGKNLIQDVVAVESGVRISLNAHALFARDSVKFRREALTPLDTLCQYLSLTKRKLIIESHTEKDSLRNHSFPSQWEFAASRATAFVRFLIQRYNYPPQQLAAVSYGSERPLFAEDQSDNSKKNQRLDILVLTNDNIY